MKIRNIQTAGTSLFKDRDGNIVIWQRPNIALAGWLVFKLASALAPAGTIKVGFDRISSAFIFAWAFLEITCGRSFFRRGLGVIIMIAIVMGYFNFS
jgi:hypothetical protein